MPWSARARMRLLGPTLLALAALAAAAAAPVPFVNPPELVSSGGELRGTLTLAPARVQIGRAAVTTTVYNGEYSAPVLRVQPGDTIRLELANQSSQPTNVHYHGFNVTPLGSADNVFLDIEPSTRFQYDLPIPADHQAGLFWYHPHFHPMVNPQIAAGLSGGIIVGNVLAPFPALSGITERVMLLKDLKVKKGQPVDDPDPSGPTLRTVSGLYQPRIDIRPGELQLWRIGNIGANIYYRLRLPRHAFYVLAQDGNLKNQLVRVNELTIPPAARYEVLVRGAGRGRYPLKTKAFTTGPAGDQYPGQRLATVVSAGPRIDPETPLPATFPPVPDLRAGRIDGQRTVVFNDTSDPDVFVIDDKVYDHDRIDTTVELGRIEEWTIENASRELHVFHIHQTDFQVTEVDGVPQPFTGYQDTVSLPIRTRKGPGRVKVIIPFTNPVVVGKFVYHCHIVQHADHGMMANIQVVPPGATIAAAAASPHH